MKSKGLISSGKSYAISSTTINAEPDAQSMLSASIRQKLSEHEISAPFVGVYKPSLKKYASAPYTEDKNQIQYYSGKVAYSLALNFCVGAGILGLPEQFNKSGYIFSPIILLIFSILAFLCVVYILDTSARAEALMKLIYHQQDNENNEHNNINPTPSLLHQQLHSSQEIYNIKPQYEITTRKFEINQLVGMFLGKYFRRIYEVMFACVIICGTWAYTVVFATALSGEFDNIYKLSIATSIKIYIGIFGVIVIPLSMLNFSEQKYLQILMTILRYALVFCITILSIILLTSSCEATDKCAKFNCDKTNNVDITTNRLPQDWETPIIFMSVAAFAYGYQYSVPSISQPVQNKSSLPFIFFSTSSSCFVLYTMLGVSSSLYFGQYIVSPCTLNWTEFYGLSNEQKTWANIIRYFIVLFPAADVISTFPLQTIALANNIVVVFASSSMASNKMFIMGIKFICACIPIILGLITQDFDNILGLAGTFQFVVCFLAPIAIEYKSKKICNEIFNDQNAYKTPYTYWYCGDRILIGSGIFMAILYCVAVYVAIENFFHKDQNCPNN